MLGLNRWLIPNWRRAHRMLSVLLSALLGLLSFLQAQILPLYQFAVPAQWWPWVTVGFATAIILARLVQQPAVSGAPDAPPRDSAEQPKAAP